MDPINEFLQKDLFTVKGMHLTVGLLVIAVLIFMLVHKKG